MNRFSGSLRRSLLLLMILLGRDPALQAQCSDWGASAAVSTAATCAANGVVSVSLYGSEVANLSNIRYGIPITPAGFSVPLNTSSSFTALPAGTYTVSVVATCNGAYVGRNTTVTVPGAYTPPRLSAGAARASLSCGPTGRLYAGVSGGVPPFQFRLTSAPAGYTGPRTATGNSGYVFDQLPPGSYTVQAADACQTGTVPVTVTVGSLNESQLPLIHYAPSATGCDSINVPLPRIDERNTGFEGYAADTGFRAVVSIPGVTSGRSPSTRMMNNRVGFRFPAGTSLKDCYGKQISFTITMPCGLPLTRTQMIAAPTIRYDVDQHCNRDFDLNLQGEGLFCAPLQFRVTSLATGKLYGPFPTTTGSTTIKGLPIGSYTLSMTTADGYTVTSSVSVVPVSGNPYSVSVLPGMGGYQGYAAGFEFKTTGQAGNNRVVELFSGPPGYYFHDTWNSGPLFVPQQNGAPSATTLLFPAGTYVWKITDDCGTYYLTSQVTAADLYHFQIDSVASYRSCQGLVITPVVRSTRNGVPQTGTSFVLLYNGMPNYLPTGGGGIMWPVYPSGTPVTLTKPGRYTVLVTSQRFTPNVLAGYYGTGGFLLGYPNIYNATQDILYTDLPLGVDMNATQGFLCKGGTPGSAQIYIAGTGGIAFRGNTGGYYRYELATPGNALSGPYLATNTTGVFTGFGGTANARYDLKVTDSCGAFAVQSLRILDLGSAALISSSSYVGCVGGRVQLSAAYLPGATYSWTGPNGFSSSVREPSLPALSPAAAGVYRVTITTTACSGTLSDTTVLALNPAPPKPSISYRCDPRPPLITVGNPVPGLRYFWDFGYMSEYPDGIRFSHWGTSPGNTPYSTEMEIPGSVMAVATDTVTGCTSRSDSLVFESEPYDTLRAEIRTSRVNVCTGDTTTLLAAGYTSPSPAFQWLRNGVAIPGAVSRTYITSQPGSYRVIIDAGRCARDTAAAVVVNVIPPAHAALTGADSVICAGDTTMLKTPHSPGYTYSWSLNGSSIPGVFDSSIAATQPGVYEVTVSNGGCIARSAAFTLRVNPAPVLNFSPSADQQICPGQSITFSAGGGSGLSYAWIRDGLILPGANASSLTVTQAGVYGVVASSAACPVVRSPLVRVQLLAAALRLPDDTTICSAGPFRIPVRIDTGFSSIVWSSGEAGPQLDVTTGGLYWVRAANTCGTFTDTFRVRSLDEYLPHWPDDTTICNASGVCQLRVPALLSNVRWNTGERGSSILGRKPGRYSVEGESPCGPVRDTILIRFCRPEISDLGIPADTICVGDCIRPRASVENYPVNYYWSMQGATPDTGWGQIPGTYCFNRPGLVTIGLRATNPGGADSAFTHVYVAARPVPRFRDTAIAAPYRSRVVLPACAEAAHADWYHNDSLICRDCPELPMTAIYYYGVYKCILRNASCPDSCSYALRVVDIPHEVWLPDAFTPNGDGRNDCFGIITDNPNVQVINLEVYNRWGQRVFVSNLSNSGWDGTFGGRPADMATYHWQLRYRVLDRPEHVYYLKGDVVLVR